MYVGASMRLWDRATSADQSQVGGTTPRCAQAHCRVLSVFVAPLQASLQNLLDLAVMSLKVRGRSRHTPG